jgi:hypothetical protein
MSDIERIRCTTCGRWIVEIRRKPNGTASPVRWRHPRRTHWGLDKRDDIDLEAVRRQIAHERAIARGWPESAELLLAEGLITDHHVGERVGLALHVTCPQCYSVHVVTPTD